jgi:hypothetical protein
VASFGIATTAPHGNQQAADGRKHGQHARFRHFFRVQLRRGKALQGQRSRHIDAEVAGDVIARAQRAWIEAGDVAEDGQRFQVIAVVAAVVGVRCPQVDLAGADAVVRVGVGQA